MTDQFLKLVSLFCLAGVQIFAALVLKYAQRNGKYDFSPQSSLVISESIKLLISILTLTLNNSTTSDHPFNAVRSISAVIHGETIKNTWKTFRKESCSKLAFYSFLLAILFAVNNILAFWVYERADPGSIILFKGATTLISAFILYIWRNFVLSWQRYLILVVQVFGLIVAQYTVDCKPSIQNPQSDDPNLLFNQSSGHVQLDFIVYSVLSLVVWNSAVGNVLNDYLVKGEYVPAFSSSSDANTFQDKASLSTVNIYIYFFGVIINYLWFLYNSYFPFLNQGQPRIGFFDGYKGNFAAFGVIMSNAFLGLAMSLVYKYADALVRCMATSISTMAIIIFSGFLFGARLDLMVFLGAVIVICGMWLYFEVGILDDSLEKAFNVNKGASIPD